MRVDSSFQMDLFAAVTSAYAENPAGVCNSDLYERVSSSTGVAGHEMEARVPIGKSGELHSPMKRKIRWYQQTLKMLGVIERVDGERGVWRLAEKATKDLDRVTAGVKLVAFSTDLGVAIWARNQDVFTSLNEPIALCFSSPPYPLRVERAYGNPDHSKYVDFICDSIEPIVRSLVPGGSIVMNLSQDIFEPKSPARSLYLERLTLALHDRLGLSLMDRMPWVNFSKPPAPTYWACVNKLQLTTAYEPVLSMGSRDCSSIRIQ